MADEKKPGFFKRLFGFGRGAEPAPAAPPPEAVVEAPPLRDEAAERIAAEIAEARRAAEAAAAAARQAEEQRLAAEKAEVERLAAKRAAAELAEAERRAAERAAIAEAARKAEEVRLAAAHQAAEKAAADRAAAAKAEAERIAAADAARQAEEKLRAAEQAAIAAAARQADEQRVAAEKAEVDRIAAAEAARKAADERQAAARAEADRKAAEQAAAERAEAERRAAAEAAQAVEAQRQAAEQAARTEAVRLAEAERIAMEQAATKAVADQKAAEAAAAAAAAPAPKVSWWQKLKSGLSRTASNVSEGITGLFTKRKLDDATLEELEDLLIQADLGIDVAARISGAVGKGRYDKEIEPDEVKAILAEEVAKVLKPVALPLVVQAKKPFVLLMVGVNGSGKTTTIGKLAAKFRAEGKSVMLAAGDTFRAAAIEQLRVWGERTGAPVIARDQGGDAAGLAFDAVKAAQAAGADVLLIDTAGRLQNRTELMAELEKVIRVIKKLDDTAPHATLLVLDATVGQNAISQVDIFGKQAGVTGLVMTKLDGTARGGILVALAEQFKLPIHFIGVGEQVDDLEPFEATDFARAIAGLERLG